MARTKKEENKEVVDSKAIEERVTTKISNTLDKKIEEVFEEKFNQKIRKEFIEEIEKVEKKTIREKNRKIFFKDFLLLICLGVIIFLLYLMYQNHYFDSYFPINCPEESVVEKEEGTSSIQPSFDELKKTYASYLDPYTISSDSFYVENLYQGQLTNELMNYYTLNSMDFSKLEKEDDYQLISQKEFMKACSSLFVDECSMKSFDYNGNKVRFFSKLDSFVTDSFLEKENSLVQREITDVQVKGDLVVISTLEGVSNEGKLSTIYPKGWTGEYHGESFLTFRDHLNSLVYTFQNKKLKSIEKGS